MKMFKNLNPGMIGVNANLPQTLAYAVQYGFGGITANLGELEKADPSEREDFTAEMKAKGIQWGQAGLPVQFRRSVEDFKSGIEKFVKQAKILRSVGVTRVSTWIMPGTNDLTYNENFEQHRKRLKDAAIILKNEGMRLGLEFVGPRTTRARFRYPFVSTQKEMLELCHAIGTGNMGLLLDAWHWYTSHGTLDELAELTNDDVVDVHVNDAPKEIPIDEQVDNRRTLPCETGVIDLKGFINALQTIGYDGPLTCEPFNQELNALENEPALERTQAALNTLFGLL